MAYNVEVKEQFSKAPQGQFQAVCCELLDLGYNTRTYKNKDTGGEDTVQNHEVQYVFQLNKIDDETGKRFEIRSAPLNLVLSPKANLRKFLTSWRGHDLLPDELKPPGVDIDLTGRNAIISVVHNESGGKTYANIGSIMPLMDGMPEIRALDYQSKQSFVDQANNQANGAAASANPNSQGPPLVPAGLGEQLPKDDIPF